MSFGFNYENTRSWIPLFYGLWVFLYDWFFKHEMDCSCVINQHLLIFRPAGLLEEGGVLSSWLLQQYETNIKQSCER